MTEKFSVVDSRLIYKGSIISLYIDTIKSPSGRLMEREVVKHLDAVGIVAITPDEEIVLVRQYRHAIGEDLLEIPAGLLNEGEQPELCATRELKEETGYTALNVEKLSEFYTSAGFTDEKFYLYFTDQLEKGEPELEEGEEDLKVEKIPLRQAVEMVKNSEIKDAKTITAILFAAYKVYWQ